MDHGAARLQDVASELGLSISTISRALRSDPRVAESTRLRVVETAQRLNYRVPESHTSSTNSVSPVQGRMAVLVQGPDWGSFFAEALIEMMQWGPERGLQVVIDQQPVQCDLRAQLTQHVDDGADIVALGTWAHLDDVMGQFINTLPIPVILINRHLNDRAHAVTLDDFAAGWQAARFLTRVGHRRIAHLPGAQGASSMRERCAGFRAGLEAAGCYDPTLFAAPRQGNYLEWAQNEIHRLLTMPQRPTAIWAYNDITAGIALVAARAIGLVVPHDISIMGFDYLASMRPAQVTTFDYRQRDLGRHTVNMALGLFDKSIEGPARICVVPTIIEGATTGPPAE